jgi:Protein of unknown function (DUF2905)
MIPLGKLLIMFGGILIVVGIVAVLAGRANLPLGRLPGDIVYRGKNTTVYFPIITCIVLSIVLSFIMWIISRVSR